MERMDVTALMLGLDERARKEVQDTLRRIAETGDTASDAGLLQMLREAIATLRGVEGAWTHAGAENAAPMPANEAEARFHAITTRARSRFSDELIRNADGRTVTREARALPETDAPGVVVITLVVAAKKELRDVSDVGDREALALALDALALLTPAEFVAMEVIWSPADPRDRASAAMIEARYPELHRLPPLVA